MTQCPSCGKDNPAEIHTCTPLALQLADVIVRSDVGSQLANRKQAAAELRRLHSENVQNAVDFVEHQRELSKALDQRDELLVALCHIEGVAMADEPRDLPGIAQTARAARAKVEGGAA